MAARLLDNVFEALAVAVLQVSRKFLLRLVDTTIDAYQLHSTKERKSKSGRLRDLRLFDHLVTGNRPLDDLFFNFNFELITKI